MSSSTVTGSSAATAISGATAAIITGTTNPIVCVDAIETYPIQKLLKSHSHHANGSKYQVNSADSKCLENKLSYQIPTCFGAIKVKSSQVKRAERSSQVKASQCSSGSHSIHKSTLL
ncbi:unnamed protein product [Adineta ricciae]|uniref:Uncharacterized protein n=1 Tax=Adineta ricciae TaxID=249248 RepID=A0A814WG60_ADIRI|nr:unnamed protein product [Adineta ricciae]